MVSLSLQATTKTGDGELGTVEAKIEKIPSSKYRTTNNSQITFLNGQNRR
jgi:hypothetical protein